MTMSFQQYAPAEIEVNVVILKCPGPELEDAPPEGQGQGIAYAPS